MHGVDILSIEHILISEKLIPVSFQYYPLKFIKLMENSKFVISGHSLMDCSGMHMYIELVMFGNVTQD